MLFGNVYTMDPQYPPSISFDGVTKKVSFFINDHWIQIGEMKTVLENKGLYVQMPDIEGFIDSRRHLDDGTAEWVLWGPRVN